METVAYVLAVVSWAIIGLLFVFLGRIAFFYERTSKQHVGYYYLIIPGLLLLGGVIWYLVVAREVSFVGHPTGDALFVVGGTFLILFGARLQELMTGERR